ncbi:MAG: aldo/keto reductase [Anaerolineae bacterium]|nr:aldo/keto reductase [Anaerolineae bacterium]
MEYRRLGRTGLKVSELCLGTMTFRWTSTEDQAYQVLDHAWDAGINFIDTADVYSRWAPGNSGGVAERIIGNWLRTRPRDEVVLATKVRGRMWDGPLGEGLSRQHIMAAVEHSLRRLQVDYIDLYQTHWPDWETPLDETLRVLDDLVTSGKVRYIGASNYPAWLLTKALWISDKLYLARYDSIQPHYNLLNRAEVEPNLAGLCLDQGIGMIPYSPLAGGFLTGKYTRDYTPPSARGAGNDRMARYRTEQNFALIDALAEMGQERDKTVLQMTLGWMLSQPFVTAPIIGANSVTQLDESLGAAGLRLSEDEMQRIDDLTGVKRSWREWFLN